MNVGDELFGDKPGAAPANSNENPGAAISQSTGEGDGALTPAVAEPNPQAAPPAAERNSPPPGFVPIDVLLRTRDEGNAAKARLRELEAIQAERERKERERAEAANDEEPDIFADPQGHRAWREQREAERLQNLRNELAAERMQERLEESEEKWSEKLGDDGWSKLNEWITTLPPNAIEHFKRQRDPYGAANKAFADQQKRATAETTREKLGGKSLEEFLEEQKQAWLAAQGQGKPQAQSAPKPEPVRAPNGQFTSPPAQQRRSAPSLAGITGSPAAAPAKSGPTSALDGLYS